MIPAMPNKRTSNQTSDLIAAFEIPFLVDKVVPSSF